MEINTSKVLDVITLTGWVACIASGYNLLFNQIFFLDEIKLWSVVFISVSVIFYFFYLIKIIR